MSRLRLTSYLARVIIIVSVFASAAHAGSTDYNSPTTTPLFSQEGKDESIRLTPFSNLGKNIFNSFIGPNTLFHLAGIGATAFMVDQDWDYIIFRQLKHWEKAKPYFQPTIYTGASCWLIISAPLFFYGYFHPDTETLGAAYAVLQSTMISIVYATLVKALTGRPYPDEKWYLNMRKQSRVFRFGLLRGGVFYGWPGGHVLITTATMASLISYYPDKWWLKVAGILLVAYTTIGVTVHGGHWMSDNIAGMLMGYAIGSTVGKSFRELVDRKLGIPKDKVQINTSFTFSSVGVHFSLRF